MSQELVTDELWSLIEPLIPPEPPKPRGGRPRVPDRAALGGIIFVLRTGIPWEWLPSEMGCGSGMTCWRRLRDWIQAGVRHHLHTLVLERLEATGKIDWSRASLYSASVPAKGGGEDAGPNPVDRCKIGSKRHLLMDRNGIPLAIWLTAANIHDSAVFEAVLEDVKPIKRPGPGHPRVRSSKLHADKAYDIPRCRRYLRQRGIGCRIVRKALDSSEKIGRYRWVVERTLAWLARFRHLVVRYERLAGLHLALLDLACVLVCFRRLHNTERSASS